MVASGWVPCRLGDLTEVKHGWPFKSELFAEDSTGLPIVIGVGNFRYTGGFRFNETSIKGYRGIYPKEFELAAGDILLVMTCQTAGGEILGIPARVPEDGRTYLHNQRLGKVVIRDRSRVSREFLYWLFLSSGFNRELVTSATGTKILHTAPSRIEAFCFSLPPITEQRAIAHVLGTLDDKIEVNRRMSETLEAMARALFKSWFVDFEPVRAKMEGRWRPGQSLPGLPTHLFKLFPERLMDSELGEIPEGWEIATIGSVAEVIDCLHSKKPERRDSGLPLLQLSNIRDDGLLDMTDVYLIDETDYQAWISRMEASPGDCVITNVGRVGAVAQIPDGQKAALGRNMTGVRCRQDFRYPTLLIECLISRAMKDEITLRMDTGTILDALNVRNIPRLRFVRGTRDVLDLFERSCRPFRARMEALLAESHTIVALRNALLPKLISGELRIRDATRFVAEVV